MTVAAVAFVLLILRLVSLVFMAAVLRRQMALLRRPIRSELAGFRRSLLVLSLVFIGGTAVPIYVDALFAFGLPIPDSTSLLVAYAISNAVKGLSASVILWRIYRIRDFEKE